MELIEKAKTWWEMLGLSKEEAEIIGPLTDTVSATEAGVMHPMCQNCMNRIDPKSFHDCCGVYDEIRYHLNDTLARSTKRRLMAKYGCDWDDVYAHVNRFLANNEHRVPQLIEEFETLRKNNVYRQKLLEINWDKDEELWNS